MVDVFATITQTLAIVSSSEAMSFRFRPITSHFAEKVIRDAGRRRARRSPAMAPVLAGGAVGGGSQGAGSPRSVRLEPPDILYSSKNFSSGLVSCPCSMDPIFATRNGALFQGDCLDLLRQLEAASVELVFADPPFNLGKKVDSTGCRVFLTKWPTGKR